MTGAGPMGLFVQDAARACDSPDVQYQFLAGSAQKTGDPMHRFPGLHAGRDPVPAGKPRLAAHHLARSGEAAGDAAELSRPRKRDKDTIVAGLRVIRQIFATEAMRR